MATTPLNIAALNGMFHHTLRGPDGICVNVDTMNLTRSKTRCGEHRKAGPTPNIEERLSAKVVVRKQTLQAFFCQQNTIFRNQFGK